MSRRRDAAPRREAALREASVGDARRQPRELYEAGPPPGTEPLPYARPAQPGAHGADAPFRGEFEQRAPGPQGQGQAGQFGSDQTLREQLCQRIADDPRLRDTAHLEVIVDEQVLTLSGEVPDAAIRDLILYHARGLGMSEVRDRLRVAPSPAARD